MELTTASSPFYRDIFHHFGTVFVVVVVVVRPSIVECGAKYEQYNERNEWKTALAPSPWPILPQTDHYYSRL